MRPVPTATVKHRSAAYAEESHGWRSFEEVTKTREELRRKHNVNRLVIIASCIFVIGALIMFAAAPRSVVGPSFMLVAIVLGFAYAYYNAHTVE